MLGTLIHKKNNIEFFKHVVTFYDVKKQAFIFKDRHLKICAEEVAYLTGLPYKGKNFEEPKQTALLPIYFTDLCKKYEKEVPDSGGIPIKVVCDLLEQMEIQDNNDRDNFKRLLHTLFCTVVTAKSGRIPRKYMLFCSTLTDFDRINWPKLICDCINCCLSKISNGSRKKSITCMVQVLEAWFNMRTGGIQTTGTLRNKDGDEVAPISAYLSRRLSKEDAEIICRQIKPENINNCRYPNCHSQERILDNEDVESFFSCSNSTLLGLTVDSFGSYIKKVLTQLLRKHSYCDEAGEHFLHLKEKFHATDNFELWQALSSEGEKILQGDALDDMSNQDKEDAPKNILEMTTPNEEEYAHAHNEGTEERGSSPGTAQDEDDAQQKTSKEAKLKQERHGGQIFVGLRIKVWWSGDKVYYPGTVEDYNKDRKQYLVKYDDGDIKWEKLSGGVKWELLTDDEEVIADNTPHPRKNTKRKGSRQQQATSKKKGVAGNTPQPRRNPKRSRRQQC